ncbi:hypothetical protein ACTHOQ_00745 [Solibacillus silvestris]|uniref:hypothetical protein n=1 Tax=Solibacillus silvestris TaxID=76853 RepID=UPI003F81780C
MNFRKVSLQTNTLQQMKDFYKDKLGCILQNETANRFEIDFGMTTVQFCNENVIGAPFYHFAFDIPSNQFSEAKQWALKRVALCTEDGENEVYFENIHAHSFYFEDPSGNIIEFICRLNDNKQSAAPFSINSIIQMSEMSLVVQDKILAAEQLNEAGIIERNGDEVTPDGLSFMGDGKKPVYLLLVTPDRRWYFSNKSAAIFPMSVTLDSGVQMGIDDDNGFYVN